MRPIPETIPGLRPTIGEQLFGPYVGDFKKTRHIEVLALFDHDWLGWHALVQVWEYPLNVEENNGEWQYGLVLCCRENDWLPRLVHDYGTRKPTNEEIGKRIDLYVTAPPNLRAMLRV